MNKPSFLDIFDFDLDRVVDLINRSEAKTVGLQFPEGFKRQAFSIAKGLEDKTGAIVIVSGNPCFGACDIDMTLKSSVDIMFHFGHCELVNGMDNVIFMETPARVDIGQVVEMAAVELDAGTVGLMTTVQHVHQLDRARNILGSSGMSCVVGAGDSRIKYPGQLLGCNFSAAGVKCDSYLYIGSGKFHPLGVAVATGSKVLAADPMLNTVEWVDPERILRQRGGVIAICLDATSFGIIVSTKIGQERMGLALRLAELAKKHGKEHIIISLDNITPDALLQFKVDAFINTACPRIAIDEGGRFNAPMLTPVEFEIVLGERDWANLVFDEIRDDTM